MSADESSTQQEDDGQLRQQLYSTARTELLERQFSNSEAYDKAILTLSSGFLALSLTFIKDLVSPGTIRVTGLLYASWIVLTAAIISTVLSFRVSNIAIEGQLAQAERYYHGRDENALSKGMLSRSVEWLKEVVSVFRTRV
jgi:hypothetical protein